MTFYTLALRHLARNRFRTLLTIFLVVIGVVAFLMLRTVTWAWTSMPGFAAKDRLVTRDRVTYILPLPKRDVEVVRAAPHIRTATWVTLFGGKDPVHDQAFFGYTLAVDPETYFDVYYEMNISTAQLETWKRDKRGAIVGDILARKGGWNVGDTVVLQSGFYAGDWRFTIDGIYTATAKSVDRSTFVFHWEYLNDVLPPERRDEVGWIISLVDDASQTSDIAVTIDHLLDKYGTQTLSQDEGQFYASLVAILASVIDVLDIVSASLLVILTLVMGNTVAMGVRERAREYGILRALGFGPRHLASWIIGESIFIGIIGAAIGVCVASLIINVGVGPFLERTFGTLFPYFRLEASNMVVAVVLATILAAAAAAIPAWLASRLGLSDAVRHVE